jgi:hypothetical protein
VAAGDFNGDAVLDLAVSNFLNNNVSILQGDGDGGFVGPSNYPAGSGPGEVVIGDFDSDEFLDLAVITGKSGRVSILRGDGAGVFSDPTSFTVGELPESVVIGDFNGDAVLDLAVANARSNNVSILHGVPSGQTGFQSPEPGFILTLKDFRGRSMIETAIQHISPTTQTSSSFLSPIRWVWRPRFLMLEHCSVPLPIQPVAKLGLNTTRQVI